MFGFLDKKQTKKILTKQTYTKKILRAYEIKTL